MRTAEEVRAGVCFEHSCDLPCDRCDARTPAGADLISLERVRQVTDKGYSIAHDTEHDSAELLLAARCYLSDIVNASVAADEVRGCPWEWPWSSSAWKPTPDDVIRQLVKAGALIAAEIDRLEAEA